MAERRVRILSTLEEISEIEEEWEDLRDRCGGSIYASHLFAEEWLRHFGQLVEPQVVLVDGKEGLDYIIPTVTRTVRIAGLPVRALGLIGTALDTTEVFELTIPRRHAMPEDLDGPARAVLSLKWDVLSLRELAMDDFAKGIHQALATSTSCELNPSLPSPWVAVPPGTDPVERFEGKAGRKIMRIMNDLESAKRLEFRVHRSKDEARTALETYVQLHRKRWAGKGESIFADPAQKGFLLSVGSRMAERGLAWVVEARIDGQVAAQQLCLADRQRVHFYRIGISDDFKAQAPGFLVMYHAMVEASKRGFTSFDLGPGGEEYKYKLGGVDRFDCSLVGKRGKVLLGSKLARLRRGGGQ